MTPDEIRKLREMLAERKRAYTFVLHRAALERLLAAAETLLELTPDSNCVCGVGDGDVPCAHHRQKYDQFIMSRRNR